MNTFYVFLFNEDLNSVLRFQVSKYTSTAVDRYARAVDSRAWARTSWFWYERGIINVMSGLLFFMKTKPKPDVFSLYIYFFLFVFALLAFCRYQKEGHPVYPSIRSQAWSRCFRPQFVRYLFLNLDFIHFDVDYLSTYLKILFFFFLWRVCAFQRVFSR